MMPVETAFLDAIAKADTADEANAARLMYADWLDEAGRAYDAALQRQAAGVSMLRYFAKVRDWTWDRGVSRRALRETWTWDGPSRTGRRADGYSTLGGARAGVDGKFRDDADAVKVVEVRTCNVCFLPGKKLKKKKP